MSRDNPTIEEPRARRDRLYAEAAETLGSARARRARAGERVAARARGLEQGHHHARWRSQGGLAGDCALSTWAYRVAHNVAASHKLNGARAARPPVGIEEVADLPAADNPEHAAGEAHALARLHSLIARLAPDDRSVILLYLEGVDARQIGEITGHTANHIGVKVHRIKALLTRHFSSGDQA
jgi:RNA polymerase sigma-70 factor (ECF subfamily)